jgi:hypothetical protein
MRYIFLFFFLLNLTQNDLWASDTDLCLNNGFDKFVFLYCQDEGVCKDKKEIYFSDLCLALRVLNKDIIKVVGYYKSIIVGTEKPQGQAYIAYSYHGANSEIIAVYRRINGKWVKPMSIGCTYVEIPGTDEWLCRYSTYEVYGQEVEFSPSLEGKDKFYDLVMKLIPPDRRRIKYLRDFEVIDDHVAEFK